MSETLTVPTCLDPIEAQVWQRLVSVTTRLPALVDAHLQQDAGLSHYEYRVLAALSDRPGHRMQLSALASRTDASLSRLSHVLNRLERRDWVRREPSPARRGYHAILTEAGYRKLDDATPSYLRIAHALMRGGIDHSQLAALLRIADGLLTQIEEVTAR